MIGVGLVLLIWAAPVLYAVVRHELASKSKARVNYDDTDFDRFSTQMKRKAESLSLKDW